MRVEPCADAERLAAVHALSIADAWSAGDLATLLASPGVFALASDADGFVLIRLAADEAEILTLSVIPAARRQGLARALMTAALAAVEAAGAKRMFLEVAEDNMAALALYGALGFAEIARREGYYARKGARVAAVVMRRDLNTPSGRPYAAPPKPERPRGAD